MQSWQSEPLTPQDDFSVPERQFTPVESQQPGQSSALHAAPSRFPPASVGTMALASPLAAPSVLASLPVWPPDPPGLGVDVPAVSMGGLLDFEEHATPLAIVNEKPTRRIPKLRMPKA